MTKAALAYTLLTLNLIFASSVLALDATSSTTTNAKTTLPTIRKDQTLQKIDTKREDIQAKMAEMKAKMASREAQLKTKLQTFKDKQKATIAQRVNTNLNNINQNQTAQMQKYLDTMTSILNKLEARVNSGTPDIKDPTAAKAAIATARANIASSSAAISAQAQKDYTIQVTTENKVKQDAQTQRELLHKDLLALRKIVVDAKQSVANAIRVAKSSVTKEKEGTPSGQ